MHAEIHTWYMHSMYTHTYIKVYVYMSETAMCAYIIGLIPTTPTWQYIQFEYVVLYSQCMNRFPEMIMACQTHSLLPLCVHFQPLTTCNALVGWLSTCLWLLLFYTHLPHNHTLRYTQYKLANQTPRYSTDRLSDSAALCHHIPKRMLCTLYH